MVGQNWQLANRRFWPTVFQKWFPKKWFSPFSAKMGWKYWFIRGTRCTREFSSGFSRIKITSGRRDSGLPTRGKRIMLVCHKLFQNLILLRMYNSRVALYMDFWNYFALVCTSRKGCWTLWHAAQVWPIFGRHGRWIGSLEYKKPSKKCDFLRFFKNVEKSLFFRLFQKSSDWGFDQFPDLICDDLVP